MPTRQEQNASLGGIFGYDSTYPGMIYACWFFAQSHLPLLAVCLPLTWHVTAVRFTDEVQVVHHQQLCVTECEVRLHEAEAIACPVGSTACPQDKSRVRGGTLVIARTGVYMLVLLRSNL